jgi:pimeloyl-ACP methyl ester carboxylesterase
MGHSMGGAGTLYLAIKYPQRWAAIAALAPAAFAVDREGLSKIPKMPIMLVHGEMDTVVPVTVGRAWAEASESSDVTVDPKAAADRTLARPTPIRARPGPVPCR